MTALNAPTRGGVQLQTGNSSRAVTFAIRARMTMGALFASPLNPQDNRISLHHPPAFCGVRHVIVRRHLVREIRKRHQGSPPAVGRPLGRPAARCRGEEGGGWPTPPLRGRSTPVAPAVLAAVAAGLANSALQGWGAAVAPAVLANYLISRFAQ